MSQILIILASFLNLFHHQPIIPAPPPPAHYLIFEQKNTLSDNGKYQIELKISDQQHRPLSNCFVTIYNQDKQYYPEYSFSFLQTNDLGLVDFSLPPGNFLMVVSTNESPTDFPYFFVNHQLRLSGKSSFETYHINLTENHIYFKNAPTHTPFLKLEANLQVGTSQTTLSQVLGSNSPDSKEFTFYTSPGTYNFDLDQLSFSSTENITYALSKYNFQTPTDTEITFDFSQLTTDIVEMKSVKSAWFKLVADGIGDFQSMYLGQPVTLKTNTSNLFLEMVYIPNKNCLLAPANQKNSPEQTLQNCTDTDIRYDYLQDPANAIYLVPNKKLTIFPPDKLDTDISPSIVHQGQDFIIKYFLNNSQNQKIDHVYIHRLWDQDIVPKYTFTSSQNQILDLAYPLSSKPNTYLKESLCLPPDIYQVQATMPLLLWGDSKLLRNNQKIEMLSGIPSCQTNHDQITPNINFSNWEAIFQNRQQLYSQSTGYLQTFPQFGSHPGQLDLSHPNYVDKCSDFKSTDNHNPIIINLNQENTFYPSSSSQFKDCLQKYVAQNYQKIFLLKNSFIDNQSFASQKSYVFYYYYLLLHQNKANQVGIIVDTFYDIFYGFPEFYVISSDLQQNYLPKNTLQQMIPDYQLIIDPKTIFYQ